MVRSNQIEGITNNQIVKGKGWDPRFTEAIEVMTEAGMTQKTIAKALSIHVCTLELWIRTKPEVKEAIARGKREIATKVERSLVELAIGYEHEDTQFFMFRGSVISQKYIKKYPPNAFAAVKWLQVNDKERWTDRKQIDINAELNINNNTNLDMRDYTDEELAVLERIGMKRLALNAINKNGN